MQALGFWVLEDVEIWAHIHLRDRILRDPFTKTFIGDVPFGIPRTLRFFALGLSHVVLAPRRSFSILGR